MLATRPRATQPQQAEPVAPLSSQQPAQTTQAQTQQQIQNGTPNYFYIKKSIKKYIKSFFFFPQFWKQDYNLSCVFLLTACLLQSLHI